MAVGGSGGGLVGTSNQPTTREVDGDMGSDGGSENVPPEGGKSRREVGLSGEGGEGGGHGGDDDGNMPSGEERVRGESTSGAGSGSGAGERREERVESPRRTVPLVRSLVTRSSGRRQSSEPKGKEVTRETPASPQVRVGITPGDYIVHASQDTVMVMAREAPGVLFIVQEELRESREAEMASARQAALEKEEEVVAFAEEFEKEERTVETGLARKEEERAQGRVTVLREARRWLSRRLAFDAETYAPPVHLFEG